MLITLTGILYGKTYFALRKQSRSMIGKKATFSSAQNRNTPNKSISKDIYSICVYENGCVRIKCNSESAESQDERSQVQSNRAQNQYKRAQREDDIVKLNVLQRRTSVVKVKNNVFKGNVPKFKITVLQMKITVLQMKITVLRVKMSLLKFNVIFRTDQRPTSFVVSRPLRNTSHFSTFVTSHLNLPSPTRKQRKGTKVFKHHYHPLQLENNAKEQRFLSTIIIIALTAVLTVMVGTINAQFYELLFEKRPQTHRFCSRYIVSILPSILLSIACA